MKQIINYETIISNYVPIQTPIIIYHIYNMIHDTICKEIDTRYISRVDNLGFQFLHIYNAMQTLLNG